MFRRNFIKGLLSSPLALLGGKEEEFVLRVPNAKAFDGSLGMAVKHSDGTWEHVNMPKGKWLPKQIVFTRVKGE
jgi:hypothetical protein